MMESEAGSRSSNVQNNQTVFLSQRQIHVVHQSVTKVRKSQKQVLVEDEGISKFMKVFFQNFSTYFIL